MWLFFEVPVPENRNSLGKPEQTCLGEEMNLLRKQNKTENMFSKIFQIKQLEVNSAIIPY
jgi:hypothetical protein